MSSPKKRRITTLRTAETKGCLEESNGHPRDQRISFVEEGHKYFIDGVEYSTLGGVGSTTFIKSFFPTFDAAKIIGFIQRGRRYRSDTEYKYYRKSAEEIKQMWAANGNQACNAGTIMHANIEHFYNKREVVDTSPEWRQFLEFEQKRSNLEPYRTEWMIFDEEFRISGAIDMLFKHADGEVSIYDWKRSKEIKRSASEKAFFPIEHLKNCNLNHYSLQLNLYKFILERNYGLVVKGMHLIVCHPNRQKYLDIPLQDMKAEILDMMHYRKLVLFKQNMIDLAQLGLTKEEALSIDWNCVRTHDINNVVRCGDN